MKTFKRNGYTFEVIVRPWKKGKGRYEFIKWVTGFRNLWEHITETEYKENLKEVKP